TGAARGSKEEAEKSGKPKTVSSSNGGGNTSHSSWQSTNLVGSQMTKKALSIELGLKEMPPEAKMRMKPTGWDTPTSAGPSSINKGHGFSDN
ncbi:hypothetical protein FD755_004379, partial [Muntiacus reevesi]